MRASYAIEREHLAALVWIDRGPASKHNSQLWDPPGNRLDRMHAA